MRILHYILGLPPTRSGGLTQYAVDLMKVQKEEGDEVSCLYPGRYAWWRSQCKIQKKDPFYGIKVFEVLNPPIIPLLYGIANPDYILRRKSVLSENTMKAFYEQCKPEILHVHTWMGFPKELLFFLKKEGVKIIFTSHDYFGICPKANLIDTVGNICLYPCDRHCPECNRKSPSLLFLRMRNSRIFFLSKSNVVLKKILEFIKKKNE